MTTTATSASTQQPRPDEPATDTGDFDFEAIWDEVRRRIDTARAADGASTLTGFDQIKQAIDHVRAALAAAPINLGSTTDPGAAVAPARPDDAVARAGSSGNLDDHLNAVDSAYETARSAGIPHTSNEWAPISAIHSAVHNLWDTLKSAASTYWTQLATDARLHGWLATLAARATHAITSLADHAVRRFDHQPAPRTPTAIQASTVALRDAYIKARTNIHAHAASYSWQRVAALWGTINTLAKQTGDPGIRAVVARSADALSDHADALSRTAAGHGLSDNRTADALRALAHTAEQFAADLRVAQPEEPHPAADALRTAVIANATSGVSDGARAHQGADPHTFQTSARHIAQRIQSRVNHAAVDTGKRVADSGISARSQHQCAAMRPTEPPAQPIAQRPRP